MDSGNPTLAIKELGGTGRTHDWNFSKQIREAVDVPLFLAGGLNPANVAEAIQTVKPFGIDVCTGVRTDGSLDRHKLKEFFDAINTCQVGDRHKGSTGNFKTTETGYSLMKLIFLHGKPGVGKLTVARELAALTGFKLFHNHLTVDLLTSVFEFGSKPFIELREQIWLDVFRRASEAGLDGLIFTFAFEKTVQAGFIENVRTTVTRAGGELFFVKLECAPEELEKRIANDSRVATGKLNSVELFRKLDGAGVFDDPGITTDQLVIDTTATSARDAASRIISELNL